MFSLFQPATSSGLTNPALGGNEFETPVLKVLQGDMMEPQFVDIATSINAISQAHGLVVLLYN